MYTFISNQNQKLVMDLESEGISFRYDTRHGVYQVAQSWASIHALLAKLRNCQNYSAWNQSLSVWVQDQELWLKFRTRDKKAEEACNFSPEETARIMDFLGRAPNLN
jgi:hypothetical protein